MVHNLVLVSLCPFIFVLFGAFIFGEIQMLEIGSLPSEYPTTIQPSYEYEYSGQPSVNHKYKSLYTKFQKSILFCMSQFLISSATSEADHSTAWIANIISNNTIYFLSIKSAIRYLVL